MNEQEQLQQANDAFAARILEYMRRKGYEVFTEPGHLNIVYIEGCGPHGLPIPDRLDEWNDLRCVIDHRATDGTPIMLLRAVATTEPGRAPTFSQAARARGGVARIAFGQYASWRLGFHQGRMNHPALVQVRPIPVHRDANRDGIRPGDRVHTGLFGINQHGTRPGYNGSSVGHFSEGCLVGRDWTEHMQFIALCRSDKRWQQNRLYIFTTTIIAGDDLARGGVMAVRPTPPTGGPVT